MTTHDAQGRELFLCSECKCRRIGSSYELDRHGHRRKGCIPCKQRRESRKAKETKAPPLSLSLPTDDEPISPPHTPQKQPLDIHCSLKRVITPFVRNGVGGACLNASAYYNRLVGHGELIEGYLVRDKTRDHYCRHYWARVDNIEYDLGSAITRRLAPHVELAGKPLLMEQRPSGAQMDDPRVLSVLEIGYQTYRRDSSVLFEGAPAGLSSGSSSRVS